MIISIGIDIIEVRRVRETIERTPRFAERVFTAAERAYCESRGAVAAQHYAARFAAKEAGAPVITFHGRARELYEQTGATAAHISIAHTTEHAIAQVILEKA